MPWYLVQLKPNGLRRATENLQRQGFGTFMPERRVDVRRRGRFTVERKPVFPGYLFVQFDPEDSGWRAVNSTFGVARLVGFGDTAPRPVPEPLIAGLRSRCDAGDILRPPETLTPGDEVTVLSGPFADFVATVETIPDQERVRVLLDLMGQKVRTELRTGQVDRR